METKGPFLGITDPELLSQQVYEDLKERILSGRIPPATILSQNQLAEKYQVSRSPVRDALKRLEQEQLVQLIPKKGALVKSANFVDAVEVTEIRRVLEGYVIQLLVGRITRGQVDKLRSHLDEMKEAVKRNDLGEFYDLERSYHERLAHFAGNRRLTRLLEGLVDPLCNQSYRAYMERVPSVMDQMYEDHLQMLQAITEGDAGKAQSLMHSHIQKMVDAMLEMTGFGGRMLQGGVER